MRQRKTDYGTIILHWLLVGATSVAFVSGLRIATETPDRAWINWLDPVLPRTNVWVPHMQAAVVLVGVSVAYVVYVIRSSLTRRIALDTVRLRGLFGRKQARFGTFSVLLTWAFFITMLTLIVSGGCLYFGASATYGMSMVHWIATWVVLAFVGLHVLIHLQIGGTSQLLRIFRPQRLPPPPPRLDAVELLTLLVEKSDMPAPRGHDHPVTPQSHAMPSLQPGEPQHPPASATRGPAKPNVRSKNLTLQANPFAVAAAVALTSASLVVASDWLSVDRLQIHRIASADAPIVDGETSDPVWRNIQPYSVITTQGDNFDGKGESRINIRAVHDGTWAYFLFTWEDPTRSLKQLPLIKQADGWHLLHDGYERGDERAYNEDKFAVLFTTMDVDLAGDRTFHASPHPLANAPATMTGRGLHYTTVEGVFADVWQWKATSGGPTGWMDDDHFGPPIEPTPMQVRNVVPYRGGFAPDPGSANYTANFSTAPEAAVGNGGNQVVTPRRLPKDLATMTAAMGQIALDPDMGESDGARWFMTEEESQPYSPELDKAVPVGTVLPGVIISGDFSGDRADVRCAARWASGHWALEVVRRLNTKSPYDIPLKSGVFMRVAAFDHSQIGHTRHVRPIRLEVE
jgi:Ethylbenzene dehydrogenase/Prokaryotic cytochrome b561